MQLPSPQYVAIYAAALSIFAAALSYIAKIRHERLRTLRLVLFLFLTFYEKPLRAKWNAENLPQHLVAALKLSSSRFEVPIDEGLAAKIGDNFARHIHDSTLAQFVEDCAAMIEPLEEALRNLARDDPLLAHRLDISSLLRVKRETADLSEASAISTQLDPKRLAQTMDQAAERTMWLPLLAASAVLSKTAARHCGIFTRLQVDHHIRRSRADLDIGQAAAHLEPAFTAMLLDAVEQAEKSSNQGMAPSNET